MSSSVSRDKGDQLIPVRMLTQYVYCRRLGYMEWVQGEFAYNEEVLEGRYHHRNVDMPARGKSLESSGDKSNTIHTRSVMLSDTGLGLVSKIDLLEIHGGMAVPVEYKRGRMPDNPKNAHDDHIAQLCAQGLLLRANGYKCDGGIIYYVASKKRVEVEFDAETVEWTMRHLRDLRADSERGVIPPPLVDSPKCFRCSLVGICLPDETNMLSGAQQVSRDQVRRMYPARDDSMPVYVQEQGAKVSLSGDRIHVKTPGGDVTKIRLIDVADLTVFGNVQVTTQAARELCRRNVPICYMTYGGWFYGMTTGASHKNVELRMCQHKAHAGKSTSIAIAREMVYGKIRNCATMLRRNHGSAPAKALDYLDDMAKRSKTVREYGSMLGLEGMAARAYFGEFSGMLKTGLGGFDFSGRNKRPPRDPVNAMLSFLYSVLARQAMVTVSAVGFDPYLGFLHMPKYGKPALALDLMEEFRPLVADSVCITMINNGAVKESDFVTNSLGSSLTGEGRRKVIGAYEQRMDSTVTHGLLGYAASYRRVMETQARLLARHVAGEIPSYPAFRTR